MIRRPHASEAGQCSALLYLSGPPVFDYFFASAEADVCRYLSMFFNKPDTAFSREYIWVEENDGAIRGALLALPGSDKTRLERNMGAHGRELVRMAGFFRSMRMLLHGRLGKYLAVIDADEYYIGNLAVRAEHRGKGVGPALLRKAEELAGEHGYRKMSLLVEVNNRHARHVYDAFGFSTVRELMLPQRYNRYGLIGFYKVVKELS